MQYISGLFILLCALAFGHGLTLLFNINFPPAIIGMLALLVAFNFKLVKVAQCETLGNLLLKYLPLFFIPAAVAVIQHFNVISENLMIITFSIATATLCTLLIVAKLAGVLFNTRVNK